MSERVPKGWSIRRAEEIYERLKVPKIYDRNDVSPNGNFPIIDQSEDGKIGFIDVKPEFDCSINNPLITFANHTCAVRKLISPFGLIQNVFPLKNRRDTDINYIFQILKGGVEPEGYKGHYPKLRETEFLVPPLPEQKKIASILTSVDEVIESTRKQIDKLQDLKKATMNELLTKGIGHTEFKDSELGRIPKSWEVMPLEDVCVELKPGPFGSSITKAMYVNNGYKVYGQEQVISGDVSVGDYYISFEKYKELNAFSVSAGDILISLVGTIGKILIIPATFQKGVINPRLLLLRLKDFCSPEFIQQILSSSDVQQQLRITQQGGTMGVLSKGVLKPLKFRIPPQSEQLDIVLVLQSIEKDIEVKQQKLQQTQSLKKSLMQDLLTGKVRVLSDEQEKT